METRIIPEEDVIRHVLGNRNRYVCWLGAGASAEAGVMTAQVICDMIRKDIMAKYPKDKYENLDVERWANDKLNWADKSRRYVTCIREGHPNEATRLNYFRRILRDIHPSFCHHATAILMAEGYLKRTCLTTNFDHLLESAFAQQGTSECQPIRTDQEYQYWQDIQDRCFAIKLHGDIDTYNVLNTREETISISDDMHRLVETILRDAGLLVLGTAGNEKSVRKVFEKLGRNTTGINQFMSFGLFWGVYMGVSRPKNISDDEMARLVKQRIKETDINQDIIDVISDSGNELFCFFPVWGAGKFMFDMVKAADNKDLHSRAIRYLDHEMRLIQIFSGAGLSEDSVLKHLDSLRMQRRNILAKAGDPPQEIDKIITAANTNSSTELRVIYGDIARRSLLGADEFQLRRRAVVSPEDTCISAGGGVAYALMSKAGPGIVLNELAKFSQVKHRSVVVTSGGNLPVHYIIHAAALLIGDDATYSVSMEDVQATMLQVLEKALALDVGALWVPLLGAGVASLNAAQSLKGILSAIRDWDATDTRQRPGQLTISVVIYREKFLPRHEAFESFDAILAGKFNLQR